MGKKKNFLKGKSVKDLLNMKPKELKSLSRSDLAKVVSKMASAGNKRLKRFEKKGVETPATRQAMKVGKFSVAGKSIEQLLAEYIRVKQFLTSETSTSKGFKAYRKRIKKGYEKAGIKIGGGTPEEQEEFTSRMESIYDWAQDHHPYISDNKWKYEVKDYISKQLNSGYTDLGIKRKVNKFIKEQRKKEMREERVDTSDWFNLE